ncbi:uncharacterized protein LOC110190611 isoform X1 [Drosophila serrata]|uniref:uncharacterized protein LOC110190611 isoform X1 n=1 Tax=Drosophila serrata TaxID=7274 RepID=UPI000A1D0B1E|nr:uncharacterized protein LOC110190611 isoform X1 [Drosophila serrata]
MNSLRNRVLIQLTEGMRLRLLSESIDKSGNQPTQQPQGPTPQGEPSKDPKKKKPENICGKPIQPTGPRCKPNKSDNSKSNETEVPKPN